MKITPKEAPSGVACYITRQLVDGKMSEWMPHDVNAVTHDAKINGIEWHSMYHESPECGGTKHWVSVARVGPVYQSDLPEFDLGNNGDKWANSFRYRHRPLIDGLDDLRVWAQTHIAIQCRSPRVVELMRDLPPFFQHGVNPLPRLRELLPGWKWEYSRLYQGMGGLDRLGLTQTVNCYEAKLSHVWSNNGEWHKVDGIVKPFLAKWEELFWLASIEIDL